MISMKRQYIEVWKHNWSLSKKKKKKIYKAKKFLTYSSDEKKFEKLSFYSLGNL